MQSTISIKPHLKKFILKYLNTSEPIRIDSNNVHGKVFMAVSVAHPDASFKMIEDVYSESLTFFLNKDLVRMRPKKREMQKINVYFDRLFKEILFQWAISAISAGDSASDGLRNFLKYYNISEDDYPWLNAHRAWMRYRKREYKKDALKRRKNCPVVS